jgi:hypothetical protein
MDLGAVGPGLAGTDLSRATGNVPLAALAMRPVAGGNSGALDDSVATLLSDGLSAPDIAKLIDLIERPLPAQETAQLQDLLRTFLSAAAEGDAVRALSALSEIVALDPSRPDVLRADPAIGAIRVSVDQFLDRHTTLARLDAVGRLEAAQEAGPSAPERLNGWDMRPETMLLIANRIFDSGGLANYVRAAELAQLVIDGSRWAPGLDGLPAGARELARIKSLTGRQGGVMSARLKSLWVRAPLLILLFAWLLLGVAGGFWSSLWQRFRLETWPGALAAIAFQVWGIGFLALIGYGFYARVRKVRF